ncbi:MAG: metallophosphoesterase [Pseudoflavonifractor sp.]|nr:metallophosphoesterase [Alloprevotella sp.]MCM1116944.1 metallophosphoesterase [Pseudoflavonifractor sp.]
MKRIVVIAALLAAILTGCSESDWAAEQVITDPKPDYEAINPRSHYVAVIGDIQEYTCKPELMRYFKGSVEWLIIQQSFFGNIDAVFQVGDLTDNNVEMEWNRALLTLDPLADLIPTIAITGNHDYDWAKTEEDYNYISSRQSSLFDSHNLPVATGMSIMNVYEIGSRANAIYRLTIGGREAHVVALEFAPRPEVVEWARCHVAAYPETDIYLLTHEWLNGKGERIDWNNSYAKMQFKTREKALAPEDIWKALVVPYDNVIAVICGHNSFQQAREDVNDAGRMVPQILFNLQYQENGGDSMLQLWEFPEGSDSVYTHIYNTLGGYHHPDASTRFNFSRRRATK